MITIISKFATIIGVTIFIAFIVIIVLLPQQEVTKIICKKSPYNRIIKYSTDTYSNTVSQKLLDLYAGIISLFVRNLQKYN